MDKIDNNVDIEIDKMILEKIKLNAISEAGLNFKGGIGYEDLQMLLTFEALINIMRMYGIEANYKISEEFKK